MRNERPAKEVAHSRPRGAAVSRETAECGQGKAGYLKRVKREKKNTKRSLTRHVLNFQGWTMKVELGKIQPEAR